MLKSRAPCKQLQDEATASSVCHKLPTQGQLVNKEEEQGTNTLDSTSCPKCHRQLPARFQDSDSEESDDRVLCTICSQKVPRGCQANIVFWIDCDNCDAWVHTYCAFSSNTTSRRYVCDTCASSHEVIASFPT